MDATQMRRMQNCPPESPCPPTSVQNFDRRGAPSVPAVIVPGTGIIFDPCDPRRGNVQKWVTFNGFAQLSTPTPAVASIPQVFTPLAEGVLGSARWTTITSYTIPIAMQGILLRYRTQSSVPTFSDAILWDVWINDTPVGDNAGDYLGEITDVSEVPVYRGAVAGTTIRIVATVNEAYFTTGARPLRSLIVGRAWARLYTVGIQPPCPDRGM